jgi:hypothetical protein
MRKRSRTSQGLFAEHSLSIVVGAIWILWLVLYLNADQQTHMGAFFGNSIADWLGTLAFIVSTKYFWEVGSKESRAPRARRDRRLLGFFSRHSLTLVIIATGIVWTIVYARSDANSKAGQVLGNIVSEWGQLLALVIMTKYFREVGSKES